MVNESSPSSGSLGPYLEDEADLLLKRDEEREKEKLKRYSEYQLPDGHNYVMKRQETGSSEGRREFTGASNMTGMDSHKGMSTAIADLPGYGRDQFVSNFLTAASQNMDSGKVVREAVNWAEVNRASQTDRPQIAYSELKIRFSDGVDQTKSLTNLRPVEFWPAGYMYSGDVMDMTQALASWHTPKGVCWSGELVNDLLRDCVLVVTRQGKNVTNDVVVPIYIYTSAMYRKVLWAYWIPSQGRWQECTHGSIKLEEKMQRTRPDAKVTTIPTDLAKDMAGHLKVMFDRLVGVSVRQWCETYYELDGYRGYVKDTNSQEVPFYMIRYCNRMQSNHLFPLSNSVAWLSDPDTYFVKKNEFSIANYMPPPGVLEYLESRPRSEARPGEQNTRQGKWSVEPTGTAAMSELIEECYKEINQSKFNEKLYTNLQDIVTNLNDGNNEKAIKKAIDEKLKINLVEGEKPTPQDIAHAIDLQVLEWKDKNFIIALSGSPRVIVSTYAPFCLAKLYRVYHECHEQPYHLLNATMRNVQDDVKDVYVDIVPRATEGSAGKYIASKEEEVDLIPDRNTSHTPAPVHMFCDDGRSVVWDLREELWNVSSAKKSKKNVMALPEDVKLRLGLWMLKDVRPLMWFLETALRSIPSPKEEGLTSIKSYRGLADVTLAREQYHQGGLVRWGAYSSSSADQATATWFAMQEGSAAVFTLRGTSCRKISPWSRFARELEYLYPPNTCFHVKTMLTEDQQQILGREELQLYELDEVDDLNALSIYITQKINTSITGQGMDLVNQLVSVMQNLVNGDVLTALERAVSPDDKVLYQPYGMEMARRLKSLSEYSLSSRDMEDQVQEVLDASLVTAAKGGHTEACTHLIELGADCKVVSDSYTTVEHAIISGHMDAAKFLIAATGQNTKDFTSTIDVKGNTLLHKLASLGFQKGVILLLKMGADTTKENRLGQIPATIAYKGNHKGIVHLLLPKEEDRHSVLPAGMIQDMTTFWASSRYSHGEKRSRFAESKEGLRHGSYGVDIVQLHDKQKQEVCGLAEGLKLWRTPAGSAWNSDSISDLVSDCNSFVPSRPTFPVNTTLPLYIHTSSVYHRVVWAAWKCQPDQIIASWWTTISLDASEAMEHAYKTKFSQDGTKGSTFDLPIKAREELARVFTTIVGDVPEQLQLLKTNLGISGFGCPGSDVRILRYCSADLETMSMNSSVCWIPAPSTAFSDVSPFAIDDKLPASSIVEFLYSRQPTDKLNGVDNCPWKAWCATPARFQDLSAKCAKKQNPHRIDDGLFTEFKMERDGLLKRSRSHQCSQSDYGVSTEEAEIISEVLKATASKIEDDQKSPETIQQMLGLQWLTVEPPGKPKVRILLCLSTSPRIMAIKQDGVIHTAELYRVCFPWGPMPADYLGMTISNWQSKETSVKLDIKAVESNAVRGISGVYEMLERRKKWIAHSHTPLGSSADIAQSVDGTTSLPDGSLRAFGESDEEFRKADQPHFIARWLEDRRLWFVGRNYISNADVKIQYGTYMIDFVKPLYGSVERALRSLKNENDPPALYRVGAVNSEETAIVWRSMAPASESKTIVSSIFSGQAQQPIIKIRSRSAKRITQFTRFSREREWAIPPGSVFEIQRNSGREAETDLCLVEVEEIKGLILYITDWLKQLVGDNHSSNISQTLIKMRQDLNPQVPENLGVAMESLLSNLSSDKPLITADRGMEIARNIVSLAEKNGGGKKDTKVQDVINKALHEAAEDGYASCIEPLLSLGAKADKAIGSKRPLEKAILRGHSEATKSLLSYLERKSRQTREQILDGMMTKHAREGNELAVLLLFNLGKSINTPDAHGKLPIQYADDNNRKYVVHLIKRLNEDGRVKIPESLSEKYHEPYVTVLAQAFKDSKVPAADALLRKITAAELSDGESHGERGKECCLHHAASRGAFSTRTGLRVMHDLIEKSKATINYEDKLNMTPLHHAVANDNHPGAPQVVKLLLEAGSNIYARDHMGRSPIYVKLEVSDSVKKVYDHHFRKKLDEAEERYVKMRPRTRDKLKDIAESLATFSTNRGRKRIDKTTLMLVGPHTNTNVGNTHENWDQCSHGRKVEIVKTFMNGQDFITLEQFRLYFLMSGPEGEAESNLDLRLERWTWRIKNTKVPSGNRDNSGTSANNDDDASLSDEGDWIGNRIIEGTINTNEFNPSPSLSIIQIVRCGVAVCILSLSLSVFLFFYIFIQ